MKTIQIAALSCLSLGIALGGCRSALAQSAAAARQPDIFDQSREVQIMTQVLQDSLQPVFEKDSAAKADATKAAGTAGGQAATSAEKILAARDVDAAGHRVSTLFTTEGFGLTTASPFRSGGSSISGNYIPTVGAIFNVGVDFPLSPPPAPAPASVAPAEKPAKDDLWEQHSTPELPVVGLDIRTNSKVERMNNGTMRIIQDSSESDPFSAANAQGPEYDPAKVEALRKAILETIGKYGYRMEHLSDDERIIVIVSSGARGRGAANPLVVRTDAASASSYSAAHMIRLIGNGTDNILFSFRKSDLKEEIAPDQMNSSKATERSYLSDGGRNSGAVSGYRSAAKTGPGSSSGGRTVPAATTR